MRVQAISDTLDNIITDRFAMSLVVGFLIGTNAMTAAALYSGYGNQDLRAWQSSTKAWKSYAEHGDDTIKAWQSAVAQRDSVIEVMKQNEKIMDSNHDFEVKRFESRESVLLQVVKLAAERKGYDKLTLADDGMVYIAEDNSWSLWDDRPTHQLEIGPCFTETNSDLSSNWCDQASLKVYDDAGPQFTTDLFNTTMVLERSHDAGHLLGFTQAY